MLYPEEFKQKVIAAFPDNEELKNGLENGDESVGRILYDLTDTNTVSIYAVIDACEDLKKMAALYEMCKKRAFINSLYDEYIEIKNSNIKRTNN